MFTPPDAPHRRLARDARGRVGEVMPSPIPAHLRNPDRPYTIMLRAPGGGTEWPVPSDEIEYLDPEQ